MKNRLLLFWIIVALVVASIVVIVKKPINLGLDLVGGSRIVIEAQTSEAVPEINQDAMNSLKYALEKRVNAIGVSETTVQQEGATRILIEVPNISDPEKAKEFLGETAELEFKAPVYDAQGNLTNEWRSTGLTGKYLERAEVTSNATDGWAVSLHFNSEGAKIFGDLTRELVNKPMAIFFNGELISSPVVQTVIDSGDAQITGRFTSDEAKKMVELLNAGALPVSAKILQVNTVGPTLGADSIKKSEFAGFIGLGLVMLFMIVVYRLPGLIADIALCIYGVLTFAAFILCPPSGVTLTLAGIAGFILSIGMAVDANILIFEGTKEELKSGRTLFTAINTGFDRAFTSIFDSNMTTILTCLILYILGTGIIQGFALTLAIGVVISMFSAITVTRNFMHLFFGTGQLKHPEWFGLKAKDISEGYNATETKRENAKFGVLD